MVLVAREAYAARMYLRMESAFVAVAVHLVEQLAGAEKVFVTRKVAAWRLSRKGP